jgi:hypothetical protein
VLISQHITRFLPKLYLHKLFAGYRGDKMLNIFVIAGVIGIVFLVLGGGKKAEKNLEDKIGKEGAKDFQTKIVVGVMVVFALFMGLSLLLRN